jgi:hypothetical protein
MNIEADEYVVLSRQMDLQMMAMFNSKERTVDDFKALYSATSPKLRFTRTYQIPEDQQSCIFEVAYEL